MPSFRLFVVLVLSLLALTGCINFVQQDPIDQPSTAAPGETFTVTARVNVPGPSCYYMGFCSPSSGTPYFGVTLPDGWSIAAEPTYAASSNLDPSSGTFSYEMTKTAEMETLSPADSGYAWWVGAGPQTDITAGEVVTITLQIKAGNTPGSFALDYMIADSTDGLSAASRVNDQPIAVMLPNQAPTISSPAAQRTAVNTDLVFSAANGNAVSIADPDVGAGALQTTLTATNGVLTLSSTTALTVTGDGSPVITATGTLTDTNAALDGLSFTPDADYAGPAMLTVAVDDQGNTGSGGALTSSATIPIAVTASQTITFAAPADTTYGDAPFVLDATASSGLPVSYSVVSGPATISGDTLTISGAGDVTVRASQPGNDSYEPAPDVEQTFTVAPAPLTITADDQIRGVGTPNPAFTASYSGFVTGDTAASLDTPVTLSTPATASSPSGSYPIIASGASDANYVITFVNGTLTVTDAPITELPRTMLYLPFLAKAGLPDLVGSISLVPAKRAFAAGEPVQITVTITNTGGATSGRVWADLYINPSGPPQINQQWHTLCASEPCFGLVWVVPSLAPGESVTLTSAAGNFASEYSAWPGWFASGTTDLYLYVDSYNPATSTGIVAEQDETNNVAALHGLVVTGSNPTTVSARATRQFPPRPRL